MKINWFAPLPPAQSGIAEFTAQLLPHIAKRAEVTLWTDATSWDRALERHARVMRYNEHEVAWPEMNNADATIYNVGNNDGFHAQMWRVSRRHPGVVILHDRDLHHFFFRYLTEVTNNVHEYRQLMKRYYGAEGASDAEKLLSQKLTINAIAAQYPLTALAADNALATIVHSAASAERLNDQGVAPTFYAPLPLVDTSGATPSVRKPRAGAERQLMMFGHIGKNRRLLEIIEALATFPNRARLRLGVYGETWDAPEIARTIKDRELRKQVVLHGVVSEAVLCKALEEADLALNLRYPTVGEASLSQLKIWRHGVPSLVSDVGWYAEQPVDTVFKIDVEREREQLHEHWQALLNDPAPYQRVGERGQELVARAHTAQSYLDVLFRVVERVSELRGARMIERLAERGAQAIAPWTADDAPDKLLQRLCVSIQSLSAVKQRSSSRRQERKAA